MAVHSCPSGWCAATAMTTTDHRGDRDADLPPPGAEERSHDVGEREESGAEDERDQPVLDAEDAVGVSPGIDEAPEAVEVVEVEVVDHQQHEDDLCYQHPEHPPADEQRDDAHHVERQRDGADEVTLRDESEDLMQRSPAC